MARAPRAETLILDIETVPDAVRWQRPEPPAPPAPPAAPPPDVGAQPAAPSAPVPPSPPSPPGDRPASDRREGRPDRDVFPPLWAHRIIVIGFLRLDHDHRLHRLDVIGGTTGVSADDRERSLLEALGEQLASRPTVVTYNGRSFDLPVIAMRSLCHAVPFGWYYRDRDVRSRYSPEGHFDLCDWLADHGATRAGKLDHLARLIGLPGKVGVDGSQVEPLFNAGELTAIENYCLADCAQTALLYLRFRLLQGALPVATYRDRVAELVDAFAKDARVNTVLEDLDRARLLGPAPPPEPVDAFA